jgi:RecJ-like exonuclease
MPMEKMIKRVAGFIRENDRFVVAHHHDADGLTSGAIMAQTLKRLGKEFVTLGMRQLTEDRVKDIKDASKKLSGKPHFIFVDFGSGQIPFLEKHFDSMAIIDHHPTLHETKHPHFNPFLAEVNGTDELSGSGSCYLVSREIDPANKDLSTLALVGAVGDFQDAKRGKLFGKNREIIQDAVEGGFLEKKKDMRLFGRHTRPLVQFIQYSSEPFIPGLSGNREACKQFLKGIGIEYYSSDGPRYYVDLNGEEKKKLFTALHVKAKQHGIPNHLVKRMIGEVYELKQEQEKTPLRDAREFATLLNACGRHGKEEIALKVCMGDRDKAYKQALNLLQQHRRMLKEGVEFASEKGVKEKTYVSVLDGMDVIPDTVVGIVAGMVLNGGKANSSKPIVGISKDDKGNLKASLRATYNLTGRGIHCGKAAEKVCEELGCCQGGGHNIAGGANSIEPSRLEDFLNGINKEFQKQLEKKKPTT